jgi:spore germination cell wall hydrolase CwlJ-like protein
MTLKAAVAIAATTFTIGFAIAPNTPEVVVMQQTIQKQETKAYNIEFEPKSLYCLADAIYHEAGVEPELGKEAVGVVILNRVQNSSKNVCSIISQSRIVDGTRRVCQYSYYCLDKKNAKYGANWEQSLFVAANLMHNKIDRSLRSFVGEATHYHADYVSPVWSKSPKMQYLGKVGRHFFYKES